MCPHLCHALERNARASFGGHQSRRVDHRRSLFGAHLAPVLAATREAAHLERQLDACVCEDSKWTEGRQ
jgi:hypothetical protein